MCRLLKEPPRLAAIPTVPVALLTVIVALLAGCSPSVTLAAGSPAVRPRFADYRFDFSLVEDTVIPHQQLWLRTSQTNITDHDVPKLDIVAGGPIFWISLVDSSGEPSRVGLPHFNGGGISKGMLTPGETAVRYHSFGPDVWFFTPESLQTALVGHTWGVAIRFSTRVFSDADSLRMKRPPLPLTVIEAVGPDAEATALLKGGKCQELLERFPQSRLVDEALRALHFSAKPSGKLELARRQARMNPASPQLISWAAEIKRQLGVTEYNNLVAELAKNHPDARALEVLKEEK